MTARRAARTLLYVGIAVAVIGLGKLHAAYVADPAYDFTGSSRFAWSLAYVAILCATAYGVGLPDLARGSRSIVSSATAGAGLAALGVSTLQLAVGDALLPRFVVFGGAALLVPWYVLCAVWASSGRARAEGRERVVLVAEPGEAEALGDDLARHPERPAQVVGTLTADQASPAGHPGRRPLQELAAARRATLVVLARTAQVDESVVAQAAALHEAGVRVRTLSLFYEQWLGKMPVAELERMSLMFDIGELHRARYGRIKRLLDAVVATFGLLAFLAAVPLVVLGNAVGNRGPLLYRQARVGRGGRRFEILKFRTMRSGGAHESSWTTEYDPRVTPFGRLLRRTHVDELPQVVNILRGDLSLVGPRPEQPHYVAELADKIPFYDLRHVVRPGLTGWAQVKYGYAGSEADALEKLQYEFFYLRHQGVALDLRVLGRTVRSVITHGGR